MAMNETEVFVCNNCTINADIYDLWLKGYSVSEAARQQQSRIPLNKFGAKIEDLQSDILDHYRLFGGLEEMLKTPLRLSHQLVYQFDPDTVAMLIQKYYCFDASVMREIFGRKLGARNRKDLDDISEETGVLVRSCRRQFENAKRVFKTVEEMSGRLVDNIQSHYCLREDLAKAYAAVVFISSNRFETGKKKLNYLTFDDFALCANHMISNWSYSSEDCQRHEDMDVDMDRDFLLDLREVKVLMEREYAEEQRGLMLRALQPVLRERVISEIDNNFRSISKTIITIANGLNHSKESRDIFIDIYEKLIEPWVQMSWTKADVKTFLTAFKDTALQLEIFIKACQGLGEIHDYIHSYCPTDVPQIASLNTDILDIFYISMNDCMFSEWQNAVDIYFKQENVYYVIDVYKYICDLGYQKYAKCFTENAITGKDLQNMNAFDLQRLGVSNMVDAMRLSAYIRQTAQTIIRNPHDVDAPPNISYETGFRPQTISEVELKLPRIQNLNDFQLPYRDQGDRIYHYKLPVASFYDHCMVMGRTDTWKMYNSQF